MCGDVLGGWRLIWGILRVKSCVCAHIGWHISRLRAISIKKPQKVLSAREKVVTLHRQKETRTSQESEQVNPETHNELHKGHKPWQAQSDATKGQDLHKNRISSKGKILFYHIGFGKGIRFRLVKDCYLGVGHREMPSSILKRNIDKTIYKGLIDQVGQEIGPADCKGFRLG